MSSQFRASVRPVHVVAAVALIAATVQYFIVQFVAAGAWKTPYSLSKNVISDLGNTACGPFAVHGTPVYVCSPLHAAMNSSFIALGLVTVVAPIMLWSFWPRTVLARIGLITWVISGVGKIFVGIYPENTNAVLHTIAASNLTVNSIAILLLSIAIRKTEPGLARFGRIVSIMGYVFGGLFIAAQFAGPIATIGLGVGGVERLAGYPGNLWTVVIALVAIRSFASRRTPSQTDPVDALLAR